MTRFNIKSTYELVKNHNSSIKDNARCVINNYGLSQYLDYNKDSLNFIFEISKIEAEQIFNNKLRSNNRTYTDILVNTMTGNLGELSFALDYGMIYSNFEKQMINKRNLNQATSYDLLNNGKKVEIKTIR